MELSYCVVNTNGRDYLLSCLESIRGTHPDGVEHEVIVLDNASDDGSAEAVAGRFPDARVIARDRRGGLAENNSLLLREARGRFCLLLNEDSEVRDGCAAELLEALGANEHAAVAGAQLIDPQGDSIPCAWRFPGPGTALAQALFLHRRFVTQSGGQRTREVDWVQSCTMLVRHDAAVEVNYLDPDFFVYSEEVDFQRRIRDAGWGILHVPAARAVHHEQLASDRSAGRRRVVQFHRGRDLYMRKHHSKPAVVLCRVLWAWSYVPRAIAGTFMSGHDSRRYWLHARQALSPNRGEGLREAAEAYNLRLAGARSGGDVPAVADGPSPRAAAS
jgi:N-acetylglucosaminyl-diphospho-decaprenol L-rhamnosyltransferase